MSVLNISNEDYLKNIFMFQHQTKRVMRTSELSQCLQVSPAAVTDKIKKLSDEKYLRYSKYKGVQLTDKGRAIGQNMVRRHRILELFLHEELGLTWKNVHEEAERLEHAVSDSLINRMESKLGFPKFDPHGDPIPSADGVLPKHDRSLLLSNTTPGQHYALARVIEESHAFLTYLDSINLSITQSICVKKHHSFDESVEIMVKNQPVSISKFTASQLIVTPIKK